jgi:hypothetical protein
VSNPFPHSVRVQVWDAVRPYKDTRLIVKDIIDLPFPASVLVGRWSVRVGALVGRIFGSDPESL